MVEVSLDGESLLFAVKGWDVLWSLTSHLEIPLSHVLGARSDPEVAQGWYKGLRLPGTSVPGVITAGTFYQDGKRIFWDVHNAANTVVVDLQDDRYDELVVEVADPDAVVSLILDAISPGRNR